MYVDNILAEFDAQLEGSNGSIDKKKAKKAKTTSKESSEGVCVYINMYVYIFIYIYIYINICIYSTRIILYLQCELR
jgi:hypothetical protein